ncbi:hypothetical protein C8J25_101712 [Sphingomonas faeni]|uniref:Uncharacterized protein n=1 Tax=Sphingomonas faeni TaxID=185950 RepID=A0A2T5UCI0_9SPHN|nr:DUF6626 family protein [Sphingomonas faeni]PTW49206.1 hypothetical protein C8J25_101712 [Sphingomonas faeni]
MSTLTDIYNILLELGLCKSQRGFSRDFLGKSDGYLSQIIAAKSVPDLAALSSLVGVLNAILPPLDGDPVLYDSRRKLRAAWIASAVMLEGERARRSYPQRFRPHPFTAASELCS